MATILQPTFEIDDFLALEREKDLLRFSTAGSVDDGKSTLIGRLLFDTQSVYEDQVRAIEGKGTTAPGQIDFALLTDGLRAEREQGITIDVAYRYFSTASRKFIIADTPGHEQYTRNMATGASTADATVVLLDAAKGVLLQSRRHAYIASLLRVRHVVVAVNKMDLIGYDEEAFRAIEHEFQTVLEEISTDTGNPMEAVFVPVSALLGDNIVHRSQTMPWYEGASLLKVLETLPSSRAKRREAFRFPVQRVVRPDANFRGFAGQIASGSVRIGDSITVLPSGHQAAVQRIVTWDGDLTEAEAPISVTLTLDRELDISRGDLIASADEPAFVVKSFKAAVVWMDQRPLECGRRYLLKHTSQTVSAVIAAVAYQTDVGTLSREPAQTLQMNGIGVVSIQLLRPIALDLYGENRSTGAFILIDPGTNSTAAAGMVKSFTLKQAGETSEEAQLLGPVTSEERALRWGQTGAIVRVHGTLDSIDAIERALFERGSVALRIDSSDRRLGVEAAASLAEIASQTGLLVLLASPEAEQTLMIEFNDRQASFVSHSLNERVSSVIHFLIQIGALRSSETGKNQ